MSRALLVGISGLPVAGRCYGMSLIRKKDSPYSPEPGKPKTTPKTWCIF